MVLQYLFGLTIRNPLIRHKNLSSITTLGLVNIIKAITQLMSWLHLTTENTQSLSKDAREVTADPDGRWFAFRIGVESLLVVEKKTVPDHLGSCDFLDKPTTVNDILTELQDAGEESELIICNSFEVMFLVNVS